MKHNSTIKIKRLGKQTDSFPTKYKDGEFIMHKSIKKDDVILLKIEGESIIVYKILNYNEII